MISVDFTTRVIYAETDMMGRVYYGRFYEYFEAARSHLLREIGLPYSEIEKAGFYLPVIESHCEYKNPATFEDELVIRTMFKSKPRSTLKVEYEVLKGEDIVAIGHTVHTFVNHDGRAVRPPTAFRKALEDHWSNE